MVWPGADFSTKTQPSMISRHWTGLAKKDRADDYIAHLKNETFRQLDAIDGFVEASILKRELGDGIEFLIITKWRSVEAIKQFAGENFETAVVPKTAQEMMIRFDTVVKHYDVNYTM
jgi:heme-degrading monooxygenase HmoA